MGSEDDGKVEGFPRPEVGRDGSGDMLSNTFLMRIYIIGNIRLAREC